MQREMNLTKFDAYREQYKSFIYKDFTYELTEAGYHVTYHFEIPGLAEFHPEWTFPAKEKADEKVLNVLLFHLGMVETISYYKCACPKVVEVQCGTLSKEQCDFWKKLYYNGLGEFLYRNGIEVSQEDLLQIVCKEGDGQPVTDNRVYEGALVPVGGGKDSVVSLELLQKEAITTYCINGNETTRNVIDICTNRKGDYVAKRKLDATLLELNKQGFLNGHIPFSAVVAFSAVISAFLSGNKYIALSNETSANETTVKDSFVNHQYSKSFEFEKDFTEYFKTMTTSDIHYFSMLRPLTEIQIAWLFARSKKYHKAFRSCNVGSKKGIWCCDCPKCLFVYIILSPFLSQDELVEIFGENLLNKESLDLNFRELTGIEENKPFECVGTRKEVLVALKAFMASGGNSMLTDRYAPFIQKASGELQEMLEEWVCEHNVPTRFEAILKGEMKSHA